MSLHSKEVVIWCAISAQEVIDLKASQPTVNSDWYVGSILNQFGDVECVAEYVCMLQGIL